MLSGTLHDPFTGTTIDFQRGSKQVQIDHVVALSNAWQTGAQQLDDDAKRNFANDPLNLIAVSGEENIRKGDADAARWLPPNTEFRCAYVERQIEVKRKYHLWATPEERDAIEQVLKECSKNK